jgi:hypothetical protein
MFRRVFRLTVKLGIIVGVGVGVALVVKKLTAPPVDTSASLAPWPSLETDASAPAEPVTVSVTDQGGSNGDSAPESGPSEPTEAATPSNS